MTDSDGKNQTSTKSEGAPAITSCNATASVQSNDISTAEVGDDTDKLDADVRPASCVLKVVENNWPFAHQHRQSIESHWQAQLAANPNYFNGMVYVLKHQMWQHDRFIGEMIAIDFKTFLYWRENPHLDNGIRDCFGSAVVVSRDGKIMLAKQRAGNINHGLTYLPGGFIDERDITAIGDVDIAASVTRELAEETGLSVQDVTRQESFLVTEHGNQISVGVIFHAKDDAHKLLTRIEDFINKDAESELESVHFVAGLADLEDMTVPEYSKAVVNHLMRTT